jgi:hypothetical protein
MTIWKFEIPTDNTIVQIAMPHGAHVLHGDWQRRKFCVWAVVDPTKPLVPRWFFLCGTGWELPDRSLEYVNTFLIEGGIQVYHLYEVL